MYRAALFGSLRRIAASMEGLDEAAIRWQPQAGANCLLVIANHTIENSTRNVLSTFCGQPYSWEREREFATDVLSRVGVLAALERFAMAVEAAFEPLSADDLERTVEHWRLGVVPGRAVLLSTVRHAAEHVGEAELTRNLWLGRAS
jgi:hypothetical protein